ncbi:hypothetical protein M8C21_034045 [Ambrosia artemisiifolia]|uniref:Uncharacterized protein n=1 Tax=Ambrosia artemisiifolia TaxID=4212 RepID=A0AAD5C7Z4_AMBAR|nr:hypothetical protein M8C21_034045 [Ambrosia artemisiifolia]
MEVLKRAAGKEEAIVEIRHSYVVPDNESSDKVITKLNKYVPFGVVPIVSM